MMSMNEEYPHALPEGTILAGQYTINKVLGQGGFGITYKATDYKTNQYVAVKEFFPDTLAYREMTTIIPYHGERTENFNYGKDCFLQEAKTLAEFIGNDNIIRIYSYFEENGTAYFVMDYIEGKSFDVYIKEKGGKISVEEAKKILIPVMDALNAVHSKGIVHRDVTPDNIYITDDEKVMLLDFGAARYSLGDKSRSLDVILKHGFAPKEQYTQRGRQGAFTDVYSLGATFYFAVTGKRPPDSIERLDEDDLIPPSNLGVEITKYQEMAILQALNVQPAERFQSMAEFKNVLLNENTPITQSAAPVKQILFQAPSSSPQPPPESQAVQSQPESPKSLPYNLKNISKKKLGIGISAVAVIAIIAAVATHSNNDGKVKSNDNSDGVVDAFVLEETTVSTLEAVVTTQPEITFAPKTTTITKKIVTTAQTTSAKKTTTTTKKTTTIAKTTSVKKTTTTTTTTTKSSGTSTSSNMTVRGNINGNIQNGGIVCWDTSSGNKYYVDDDWHSIYKKDISGDSVTICHNEDLVYSNLCYYNGVLYFNASGRACFIEDGDEQAYYLDSLDSYSNIKKLYITDDYYFVYDSETLYRISKVSGKSEESIDIDFAVNFTICDGYLYVKGIGDNGVDGIFKVPADNFSAVGTGITNPNGSFSCPVIDNGYLYMLYIGNDNLVCQIARLDADTMNVDSMKIYDVSDLITNNYGWVGQLNVKGNNIFFTSYYEKKDLLYHITVNGENWTKELISDMEIMDPNIIPFADGSIEVIFMEETDSGFESCYCRYDSDGNFIKNN